MIWEGASGEAYGGDGVFISYRILHTKLWFNFGVGKIKLDKGVG